MTVSDAGPICVVIKAALSWNDFDFRADCWIYLDSNCILHVGLLVLHQHD